MESEIKIRILEDEYDITIANEAYQEYINSGCKTTPLEEFWRELDSEDDKNE